MTTYLENLQLLTVLGITMIVNIGLGIYNSISIQNIKFDKIRFYNGLIKAVIIALSVFGLSYCFNIVDLSELGITPALILNSAIVLYVGKDLSALGSILGVNVTKK